MIRWPIFGTTMKRKKLERRIRKLEIQCRVLRAEADSLLCFLRSCVDEIDEIELYADDDDLPSEVAYRHVLRFLRQKLDQQ